MMLSVTLLKLLKVSAIIRSDAATLPSYYFARPELRRLYLAWDEVTHFSLGDTNPKRQF
jgi:hypothetical protein